MSRNRNRIALCLTTLAAAAVFTLTGPAKAQIAAGFESDGKVVTGFSWNVNTNAVSKPAPLPAGSQTALFGVSKSASMFCGIGDGGPDGPNVFQGICWDGVNGSVPKPCPDTGVVQGFPGNDLPVSINDNGYAVGQGVGQIAGYDQGMYACILWADGCSIIVDTNAFQDPAGKAINSSLYYSDANGNKGPIYLIGVDPTGLLGTGAGINNDGLIACLAGQTFGNFYYQGVICPTNFGAGGGVFVIPYTDQADPAATSFNISEAGATCGYNFENNLSAAYGYTATITTEGYKFSPLTNGNAGSSTGVGGSGKLTSYGQGPNNNFIWGLSTNDDGSGNGQLVGFDIDNTGTFNHAIYAKNSVASAEVAADRGGNTTFLRGVAGDGTSAGFETIKADGEANFHAWGTKTGTPGATTDYPEGMGIVASKAFQVSSGGGGNNEPQVQSITIKGKPKHGKPIKGTVTLTGPAGAGGLVVTVSSTLPAGDLANFTVSVPGGATTANFKSPKLSKTSKGHTGHLVANPGNVSSATFTIK